MSRVSAALSIAVLVSAPGPAWAAGDSAREEWHSRIRGTWVGVRGENFAAEYDIVRGFVSELATGMVLAIGDAEISLDSAVEAPSGRTQRSRYEIEAIRADRITISSELRIAGGYPGRRVESDLGLLGPDRLWLRPNVSRGTVLFFVRKGAEREAPVEGPAIGLPWLRGEWVAVESRDTAPDSKPYADALEAGRTLEFRDGVVRFGESGSGPGPWLPCVADGERAPGLTGWVSVHRIPLHVRRLDERRIVVRFANQSHAVVYRRSKEEPR
jgi:hypothetical protein